MKDNQGQRTYINRKCQILLDKQEVKMKENEQGRSSKAASWSHPREQTADKFTGHGCERGACNSKV